MKLTLATLVITLLFGACYAVSYAEYMGICRDKCPFYRYSCYLPHPENCQKVFDCAFGTFFSELKGRCDHASEVDCPHDPCKKSNALTFGHKVGIGMFNCRAYWVCRNRKSYPACCKSGSSYVDGKVCVRNKDCRSHCDMDTKCTQMEPGPTCRSYFKCSSLQTFVPMCCPLGESYDSRLQKCKRDRNCTVDCDTSCPYKAIIGNKKAYLHGGVTKQTPPGTVFDQTLCGFVPDREYRPGECEPNVDISFSGRDTKQRHIDNFGVKEKMGVGHFENDSHIEIPFYQYGSYWNKVFVSLRFKTSDQASNSSNLQVLLSNCRTDERSTEVTPSFHIILSSFMGTGLLIFTGTNTVGETKVFELPFERRQWNSVWVEFNGRTLRAKTKPDSADSGSTGEVILKGTLKRSVSSLSIGGCADVTNRYGQPVDTYFDGEMDDIKVYTDCMPEVYPF